jgi:SpoIID/LytB domain protein
VIAAVRAAGGSEVTNVDAALGFHHVDHTAIGAHRIDDCDSANGTFVNSRRIRGPVQLADGMTIRIGSTSTGRSTVFPLEVYVARVLAGEGEPRAADAAQEALAVAIRTFAAANQGRHSREGFDLCDSTHCQVPRAATPQSRRAALVTAGRMLLYQGRPAEVFYSASCGGQSETAAIVWPGADYPYLQTVADDVHDDDVPWTLDLPLRDIQRALTRAGFEGARLTDVVVEERSESGRAARLRLTGLRPALVGGDQFRAAIGAVSLRSTAFSIERMGDVLRFTGRGFGHGVGMCVIGAGRRAVRGESVDAILAHYYPGLFVTPPVAGAPPAPGLTAAIAPVPPVERRVASNRISVLVPRASAVSAADLERTATAAYDDLSRRLGASVAPIELELHESIQTFRQATGRPWWVSGVVSGTAIDLAPAAVLAERDGLEAAVRTAVAELLVSGSYAGRPAWMRVGAARYFSRAVPPVPAPERAVCPSDAELTLAISAEDQRDADQADLSTPGIEERLYRCHILAGHVAPLLENPGEFALFRQHSDLLANGIGYSAWLIEFDVMSTLRHSYDFAVSPLRRFRPIRPARGLAA